MEATENPQNEEQKPQEENFETRIDLSPLKEAVEAIKGQ